MRGSSVLAPGHGSSLGNLAYLVTPPGPSRDLVSHKGCRGKKSNMKLMVWNIKVFYLY